MEYMEVLKKLFNTIIEFKKLKPWNWMGNNDIFGIEHPETKQKGYCCVMGAGGETYGLSIYLDQGGLRWLGDRLGKIFLDSFTLYAQDYIAVTFGNAGELYNEEKQLIKDLGYQFRGKLAYPMLRRSKPGSMPEFISEKEADFLTIALEQVMQIAPKIKKDPDYLFSVGGKILMRKKVKGKINKWLSSRIDTDVLLTPGVTDISEFSKIIRVLKTFELNKSATWAADMYFIPEPVVDRKGDTPFFPLAIIIVDPGSELILTYQVTHYTEYQREVQKIFIEAVKKFEIIPGKIITIRPEIFFALAPFQKALGIEMIQEGHIPAVENIKREFMSMVKINKRRDN